MLLNWGPTGPTLYCLYNWRSRSKLVETNKNAQTSGFFLLKNFGFFLKPPNSTNFTEFTHVTTFWFHPKKKPGFLPTKNDFCSALKSSHGATV